MGRCTTDTRGKVDKVEYQKISNSEGMRNSMNVMRILLSQGIDGMTPKVAAGICGNLYVESINMNPTAVGDNGLALGLAQWHPARQKGLVALAQNRGTAVTDLETQANYVAEELTKKYPGVWRRIKGSNSISDVTLIIMDDYETPSVSLPKNKARNPQAHNDEYTKRLRYANTIYENYMK